jgi:hypothetical protein
MTDLHPDHTCDRYNFHPDADQPNNEIHVLVNVQFPKEFNESIAGMRVVSYPTISFEEGESRGNYINKVRECLNHATEAVIKQLQYREDVYFAAHEEQNQDDDSGWNVEMPFPGRNS